MLRCFVNIDKSYMKQVNLTKSNLDAVLFHSQIQASTPVLMCSVPGYDASGRVDDLAAELGKQLTSIAIGKICLMSTLFKC